MIFTLVGVAIGLGNVWRFPYMMGKYGGSAFLLVYLLFTILFALPALMGEITFGRVTQGGLLTAFRSALGARLGRVVGYLLLVTILVASSYYAVVIANVVYSSFFSLARGFSLENFDVYLLGLENGLLQYGLTAFLLVACLMVLQLGLNKGIEWVSKIFVPFFLVVILFLIYYTFSLEGARSHVVAFLRPDFKALEPVHVFAALGQAFYSLSLGGTFMVIYGGYLDKKTSIARTAAWTAGGDVGAALLTSLFIVPAILVFKLDMTAGPTLIFQTLPHLFSEIAGGRLIGSVFLFALSLVAFLSLVAALAVAQACFRELFGKRFKDGQLLLALGILELLLVIPSASNPDFIGFLDLIFGSGMQVLGSGITLLALTWGLGKAVTLVHIKFGHVKGEIIFFYWLRWVIPLVLAMVLIGYIYSSVS